MKNRKYMLIDKYDVISFDMFDTLITRNLDKPSEVFDLIQKRIQKLELNIKEFKLKRIEAEHQAHMKRECGSEKKKDLNYFIKKG